MDHRVERVEQVVHGAPDYAELARLGLRPDEIIDFSVNSNPYGPSPRVREAISHVAIERYPDRDSRQLREALVASELADLNLVPEALLCGNGSSELIWIIARAYLQPGQKTLLLGPTFGEYRAACQAAGATVIEVQARAEEQFEPDITNIMHWLQSIQPRVVWLCNPNNPTGAWMKRGQVQLLADWCQHHGSLLVVDESYIHFVFPHDSFSAISLLQSPQRAHVLVMRSLTKDFALAGVRLGYVVGVPENVRYLAAYLPSWNVSGLAQAAGYAAVTDRTHLQTTLELLTRERAAFFSVLHASGLTVVPSYTHFCLIRVGEAGRVRQALIQRKLLVRDCTSFGLPQYIRVSTRPEPEWRTLLHVLEEAV